MPVVTRDLPDWIVGDDHHEAVLPKAFDRSTSERSHTQDCMSIDSMLSICYYLMVSSQPELDSPPSRFALAVFWVNGLLMNNGERITKPLGQSSARWQVLGRASFDPQTVAGMARDMGLARQSVQRIVNVLKRDGLVALEQIPSDKRTSIVTLTEAGRKVLSAIYARNAEWSKRILSRIPVEELEAAIKQLERIGTILEEDSDE